MVEVGDEPPQLPRLKGLERQWRGGRGRVETDEKVTYYLCATIEMAFFAESADAEAPVVADGGGAHIVAVYGLQHALIAVGAVVVATDDLNFEQGVLIDDNHFLGMIYDKGVLGVGCVGAQCDGQRDEQCVWFHVNVILIR